MKDMKKIIASGLMCFALLASCSILDIEPETQWAPSNTPTTLTHLTSIMYGGYERMNSALQQRFSTFGDQRSDTYYPNAGSVTVLEKITRSNLDPSMSETSWSGLYQVIKQANVFIHHYYKLVDEGAVEYTTDTKHMLGQAYCMRAFAYFWIVRVWGDACLALEPLEDASSEYDMPRSPVADVMVQIHEDLDSAIVNLRNLTGENVTRTRFCRIAARAIKAHAYAWTHDYDKAIPILNTVISSSDYKLANLYDASMVFPSSNASTADKAAFRALVDKTEYMKLFASRAAGGTGPENIFELPLNEMDGIENTFFDNWFNSSTTYFKVREEFDEVFERTDLRYWAFVADQGASDGEINARKWVTGGYERGQARNIVLIRLGELYLLRAEARIMTAGVDPSDADRKSIMADINAVITRAKGPGGAIPEAEFLDHGLYTQETFIELLRYQRRIELAFEGYRWFDLARWGITLETLKNMRESNAPASYPFDTSPVILANDGAILWPIHQQEIRRSRFIIQNEYYR